MNEVQQSRWRRKRRACAAGAAVSVLLSLSGCSGEAGAPATVGPTAGADVPAPDKPKEYEPTLPPYTSEVELSAEDEADVEELLLLIDEFSVYTSDVTEMHQAGVRGLQTHLDPDLFAAYQEFVTEVESNKYSVSGSVSVTDTGIWRYESGEYAMVGICLKYDHWGLLEAQNEEVNEYHDTDSIIETMAYIEADRVSSKWELYNQKFYSNKEGCDDLH